MTKPQDWIKLFALFAVTAIVALFATQSAYFPGDIALAKFIQSISGENVAWAKVMTSTVSSPWNYVLLTFTAAIAWWLAGWRAALIAVICFGGMVLAEPHLKALVGRPRPSAQLIHVTGSPSGFSFPSGFGLIFFSMFGLLAMLAWQNLKGNLRSSIVVICSLLLLIGGCARVTLGAHWSSDILGAYLCGGTWVLLLLTLNNHFAKAQKH